MTYRVGDRVRVLANRSHGVNPCWWNRTGVVVKIWNTTWGIEVSIDPNPLHNGNISVAAESLVPFLNGLDVMLELL